MSSNPIAAASPNAESPVARQRDNTKAKVCMPGKICRAPCLWLCTQVIGSVRNDCGRSCRSAAQSPRSSFQPARIYHPRKHGVDTWHSVPAKPPGEASAPTDAIDQRHRTSSPIGTRRGRRMHDNSVVGRRHLANTMPPLLSMGMRPAHAERHLWNPLMYKKRI